MTKEMRDFDNDPIKILSIGGFDPSGFSGVLASIRKNGFFCSAVMTDLLTRRGNDLEVLYKVPAEDIHQEFETILSNVNIEAVTISKVFHPDSVSAIAENMQALKPKIIVLDLDGIDHYGTTDLVNSIKSKLLPIATTVIATKSELEFLQVQGTINIHSALFLLPDECLQHWGEMYVGTREAIAVNLVWDYVANPDEKERLEWILRNLKPELANSSGCENISKTNIRPFVGSNW